ncbi:hypothetical protein H8D64_00900 [PVC group bacterium]|nr:hypothetical protein [PVC group bacterium]
MKKFTLVLALSILSVCSNSLNAEVRTKDIGDKSSIKTATHKLVDMLPSSLSFNFDKKFLQREWKKTSLPKDGHWLTLATPGRKEHFNIDVTILDVSSRETAVLVPEEKLLADNLALFRGETMGIKWTLVTSLNSNGTSRDIYCKLKDDKERCLFPKVVLHVPDMEKWEWHDDYRFRRSMLSDIFYNHTAACCFGSRYRCSIYTFGVISTENKSIVIETDPHEPRIFTIEANTRDNTLSLGYDLALTPETRKFPGAATFHCEFSVSTNGGASAFRHALMDFYKDNPAFREKRVPKSGLWMPFDDISKIPDADDFGFAFFEQGGPRKGAVDYCESKDILTLVYIEPWLYWLPMDKGAERSDQNAIKLMNTFAKADKQRFNEFASSALLGAIRKPDGSIEMSFHDVPWNSGARMEVNTDPELAVTGTLPLNRSMMEWKFIEEALKDERVDGIYLDSMQAMQMLDYNPNSLAVADHPASYVIDKCKPGQAMPIAAHKFTAALARALKERNKYVMANFPCWNYPFFMPYIDIPGEETCWLAGTKYNPMSDQDLNYRRAISGNKPFGFLQATHFDDFKGEIMERFFRDCMFWAFLPSFFSHDGANKPYWQNAGWYERDRPFFKTYMPIIRRLADAGWHPLGPAYTDTEELWVENFGSRKNGISHITIRNSSGRFTAGNLLLRDVQDTVLLLNPLNGNCRILKKGESIRVGVRKHDVETFDIVPLNALNEELDFMRRWNSGNREAEACLTNLESVKRELHDGLSCDISWSAPLVAGEKIMGVLEITNTNDVQIVISGFSIKNSEGENIARMPSDFSKTIPSGKKSNIPFSFIAKATPLESWLNAQWSVKKGEEAITCERLIRTTMAKALEISSDDTRIETKNGKAIINVEISNNSFKPQIVSILWDGFAATGRKEEKIKGHSVTPVTISIPAGEKGYGYQQISIHHNNELVFQKQFYVTTVQKSMSFAAKDDVVIVVDSLYPGYLTEPINDGIIDVTGLSWNEAAFASGENHLPHSVEIMFPDYVTAKQVIIHWHKSDSEMYTSRKGKVTGIGKDGNELELGCFNNTNDVPLNAISFDPVTVQSIRLTQPGLAGSKQRPKLLWIREMEVF